MQPAITPASRALIDAAVRARADLQGWMKLYGHDLDTAAVIADLDRAIRKATPQ